MQQQMALTLDAAREAGLMGMQQAVERADEAAPGWSALALAAFLKHLQTLPHTTEFLIEDVRLAVEPTLPQPTDCRAWGSVTRAAIRRMHIIPTGRVAPAKSSHASPKRTYRRGGEI